MGSDHSGHGPHSETDPKNPKTGEESPYMTKEFPLDGPGLLKIFTLSGDITVEHVPYSDKITVELYVDRGYAFWSDTKNLDNYRITMRQRGNEVVASVEPKSEDRGIFSDQITFSYKVYVPENVSTQIKTSGGDISITGMKGDHTLKTSGGNINVSDIEGVVKAYTSGGNIEVLFARGTIFAQTEGGSINLEKTQGEIRLVTNGGGILASRISGSMLAKVAGGDIRVDFLNVSQGIGLETSAGKIDVTLPGHQGYKLDLKGTKVFIPNNVNFSGNKRQNSVTGTILGGGNPVDLSTNYGSVTLNINNQR